MSAESKPTALRETVSVTRQGSMDKDFGGRQYARNGQNPELNFCIWSSIPLTDSSPRQRRPHNAERHRPKGQYRLIRMIMPQIVAVPGEYTGYHEYQ